MTTKSFNARHGITVGVNQVAVADANGNITANTILVGGSALNSTAFAGTANNASYFNNQPASYYTNASNLSTGTINALRLPTSGVTANVYGNSSQIPVVTVDTYGRVTSITTSAVAGVTSFSYTAANSTLSLGTGDGSTYTATISAANSTVAGVVTVLDSTTNTSITIAASANTVKNAFDRAIDANTRAASAQTAAISAYSNAVSYTDSAIAAANVSGAAATAYSNAVSYASSAATTAYSNAVSVAASDATNKAANAYSNAVSYASTIAGTAYTNATSYADSKAATAYSNATSYADTKAATAYSNATSYAATIAGTAYSNAVSTAAADASSKAGVAYINATAFAANASNINSGTVAEARLPYRMNQNVRTTDTVEFANMTVSGNLTVTGTTVTVNANNLVVQDNMIYLNDGANTVVNPDLGIAGAYNDGTYRHTGFFRDATDGVWKVYDQYLPEPDASPYIDTSNASFRVADFQANVVTMASANVGGAIINSTSYSGAANNASYLGTYAASAYPRKSEAAAIDGAWNFSSTNIVWSGHSYTNTHDGSNVYLHIGQATSTDKIWNLRVFRADNSVATFAYNGAGRYATAEGSWRAPVFYDTDNTNYFVDAAGYSQLKGTSIWFNGTSYYAAFQNSNELNIYTAAGASSDMYLNWQGGDVNMSQGGLVVYRTGGYTQASGSLRAPIFYDTDNTGYYLDPATGSNLTGQVQITGGTAMSGGWNRTLYLAATFPTIVFNSNNSKYSGIAVDYTEAQSGMVFWVGGTSSNISDGSATIALRLNTGNYVVANDMRAAIFYDTNNTAYYLDGSATSNIVNLTVNGVLDVGASNPQYWRSPNSAYQRVDGRNDNTLYSRMHWYGVRNDGATSNFRHAWFDGSAYFGIDADTGFINFTRSGGGAVTSDGSFRAPIFYDSNNTSYYVDAAGTSVFNAASFASDVTLPSYAGTNKFSSGTGDGASTSTYNFKLEGWYGMAFYNPTSGGAYPYAASGYVNFRDGWIDMAGSLRAPIFYDRDNTAYYADPHSTSQFNTIETRSGSGFRSFVAGSSSIASSIYFGNAANTIAWNWQIDENNRGALWSYDGSGWSKSLTISHRGAGVFLRNNAGTDVLAFSTSNFGYSAAYKTLVIGDQAYTTVCIGVDPVGNASGSFNGNGSGVEVMFKNGVSFITPNSANNGYNAPLYLLDGYAYNNSSIRSPILYDYNNTAYYVDPASTTYINQLQILGGNPVYPAQWTTGYQSGSDFVDGTLVATDIPATASAGDSFIIEITGKSYSGSNPPFKVIAQGYLYNDTIISYSGLSYGGTFSTYIKAFQDGGVLKFWWPRISYWNSFNVRVISMDGPTNNTITRNRITSITNSTEPTGTKKVQINLGTFMRADISATNSADLRAPIFYDSDDTNYYLNPNGDSVMRGTLTLHDNGANSPLLDIRADDGAPWAIRLYRDDFGNGPQVYASDVNTWYFNHTIRAGAAAYAPIFYDENNTGYYVDPASTSALNALTVGGVSVALGSYRNYGQQVFAPAGYNTTMTTAQFMTDLSNKGMFNYRHAVAKASWDYAGNNDLNDIGFNGCDLAGTVVETFTDDAGYKTVWLTRPTTGAGNGSIYVWNDQGSGYSPGWRQVWTSGVSCYNGVDIRAPIFYDIDNTASFIDPAGTSRIGGEVRFGGGGNSSVVTTNGDFYSRRADATNTGVYYFADGGNKYLFWDGSRYYFGAQGPVDSDVSFRGAVFYDLSNTGYYLDPANTSSGNLRGRLNFGDYGAGIVGSYDSYRYQLVFAMGSSYAGAIDGTNVTSGYGLWWSHPNAGGVASNLSSHGLMCIVNGNFYASLDASTRAISDMRTPVFYDLNDTGYYTDPNSTSRIVYMHANNIGVGQGINSTWNIITGGTTAIYLNGGGYGQAEGSWRAPIFYDSNDTSFYMNPHETSVTRVQWIKQWGGTAASPTEYLDWPYPALTVSAFGNYTQQTMLAFALPNDGNYFTNDAVWNFRLNQTANATTSAGVSAMNFGGPGILYLNPSSYTQSTGSMRAPIFYDTDNTGYYFNSDAKVYTIYADNWFRSYGNTGWYNETYAGGWFMEDSTWVRIYNNKNVYTSAEIAAGGNITAYYSDERLKTKTGTISNAINKVQSLEGFTYVENELARSLGYKNKDQQVGVSAQQVQAVLPEAVSLAPIDYETLEDGTIVSKSGENYLTVDYSRLVPLLIEAIKEQQLTITEQSAKINTLEAKLDQIIQKLEG